MIKNKEQHAEIECYLLGGKLYRGISAGFVKFSLMGELYERYDYEKLFLELDEKLEQKSFDQVRDEEGTKSRLFQRIEKHFILKSIAMVMQTLYYFADGRMKVVNKQIMMDNNALTKPLHYDRFVRGFVEMFRV